MNTLALSLAALPVVNINGTSRKELLEQRINMAAALRDASAALSAMSPHGRDYQTTNPERFEDAKKLHAVREASLRIMLAEIEQEAEAIANGP